MELLIGILITGVVVFAAATILPGVTVTGFGMAIVVAVVLAVINALIKPLFIFLTLPINILTLGFFTFVINALLVMLTDAIVPGFEVASFWWALAFGVVMGVLNWGLSALTEEA